MLFVSASSPDGRKEKFVTVYEKYYKYVYKIAYIILKDHSLMEDLVQEIFLKIWKGLDSIDLEDETAAKAFVAAVARNTTINRYNKNKKISPNVTEVDHDILFATASDRAANPSDIVTENDTVEYIYNKIEELGDIYSHVMLYKYKFGMSAEEIALVSGTNIKTVYTKLSRGRELLKAKICADERRSSNEGFNRQRQQRIRYNA